MVSPEGFGSHPRCAPKGFPCVSRIRRLLSEYAASISLLSVAGVRGRSRSQLHMAHELTCRCLATSGPETRRCMWADDYSRACCLCCLEPRHDEGSRAGRCECPISERCCSQLNSLRLRHSAGDASRLPARLRSTSALPCYRHFTSAKSSGFQFPSKADVPGP